MTLAQIKAKEAEADHAEMCDQERLRRALIVRDTQRAGWELVKALAACFAVLLALGFFIKATRDAFKGASQAAVMAPTPYDETGVMDR